MQSWHEVMRDNKMIPLRAFRTDDSDGGVVFMQRFDEYICPRAWVRGGE